MKSDGQNYLDQLADSSGNGFQRRFSKIAVKLGLKNTLTEHELRLLYEATFLATLCNIAFNGLGGCAGEIRPELEANRINLERDFMAARDKLHGSVGWEALPASVKGSIRSILLSVRVTEDNSAE